MREFIDQADGVEQIGWRLTIGSGDFSHDRFAIERVGRFDRNIPFCEELDEGLKQSEQTFGCDRFKHTRA